jgi:hypothetical protein
LLLALPSICAKFVTSSRVILLSSFSPLIYLLLYQVWQHQLDEKARATTQAKLSDADITEVDGNQVFQEAERKVPQCNNSVTSVQQQCNKSRLPSPHHHDLLHRPCMKMLLHKNANESVKTTG